MSKTALSVPDIESLHLQAISCLSDTYIDPPTGFTVLTEYAHLKRGVCCGNRCRHCPFGWERVKGSTREGSVKSGKSDQVKRRLAEIRAMNPREDGNDSESERSSESSDSRSSSESEEEPTPPPAPPKKKTGGRHGGSLTSKNVPYTRGGDAGSSSLFSGQRRRKDHELFESMGDVDELCSVVGVVHALILEKKDVASTTKYGCLPDQLMDVMSRLFDIGAIVARLPSEGASCQMSEDEFEILHVPLLEEWIDTMTDELPQLTSFLLPSGSVVAAQLHVCRTVCRRAERSLISVIYPDNLDGPSHVPESVGKYLNRLSDYFFTVSRYVNWIDDRDEVLYCRPGRVRQGKKLSTMEKDEEKKEGIDQRRQNRRRRVVVIGKDGNSKIQ